MPKVFCLAHYRRPLGYIVKADKLKFKEWRNKVSLCKIWKENNFVPTHHDSNDEYKLNCLTKFIKYICILTDSKAGLKALTEMSTTDEELQILLNKLEWEDKHIVFFVVFGTLQKWNCWWNSKGWNEVATSI